MFEGIQAVLFLISCSDFDQTLREDATQNRLKEALELFSGVWHNRFLSSSGIIVFLNKQDIMEMKIRNGKRMEDYYPDFRDFKISANEGNVFDECDRLRLFIKHKLIVSFLKGCWVNRDVMFHVFLERYSTTSQTIIKSTYSAGMLLPLYCSY